MKKTSTHALAAKQIRKELKQKFNHIKFKVTSKTYSGGDSITVYWENGVSQKQVMDIIRKYQYGTFDAMTDSYDYDYKIMKRNTLHILREIDHEIF